MENEQEKRPLLAKRAERERVVFNIYDRVTDFLVETFDNVDVDGLFSKGLCDQIEALQKNLDKEIPNRIRGTRQRIDLEAEMRRSGYEEEADELRARQLFAEQWLRGEPTTGSVSGC